MPRKVLVVNDGCNLSTYGRPFRKFGEPTSNDSLLWINPQEIALVVFTGGADLSPSLYGQGMYRETWCAPRRDIYESVVYHRARALNLPLFGICRGAQFLNVMAGGSLCQHLLGHNSQYHFMRIEDGRSFEVSSAHHQMMLPPEDAHVIAWAETRKSDVYFGEKEQIPAPDKEYEVIHFPKIRAVGVQYHPEIMGEISAGFSFPTELIVKYLLSA